MKKDLVVKERKDPWRAFEEVVVGARLKRALWGVCHIETSRHM